MELRGLGVINVKELFGIASTRSSKRVELVVQLERWDPTREYERLGLDDEFFEILGLHVPLIRMPVAPGRNIAILVEVAARNQLLRARGHHAARVSPTRSKQRCGRGRGAGGRTTDEDDDEDDRGRRTSVTRRRQGSRPRASPRSAATPPFIVLTGLSGSGKSQAIRALEDLGYFCVDNLPTTLIPTLAKLSIRGGDIEKVAIVVDVREGNFLSSFPKIFRQLRKMRGSNPVLIFLEASNSALVRRFSETRRPHPLAPDRSVSEGIRDERARLTPIREHGRRDRRHLGHDGARAAPVLHGPVARPGAGAAGRHAAQLRLQARRAASMPIWCSTCAACRIRISCRRCGGGPAATGRSSQFMETRRVDARVHGAARGVPAVRRCRTTSRKARAT